MIKFKVQASALTAALDIVGIVEPKPITPAGGTGYLFVVRKNEQGEDRCYVYSRDLLHVSRADFAITEVEGEGPFIYPEAHINAFKFADGEVAFTANSDGDVHSVRYELGYEAGTERPTFDPKLIGPCDKKIQEATGEHEFPVSILREAIRTSTSFVVPAEDTHLTPTLKHLTLFDQKERADADGTFYATNSVSSFYFKSDALKGKNFQIHSQHIPFFTKFLAKAEGKIQIRSGPDMTFAIDSKGRALGWNHSSKSELRFTYYATSVDKVVLGVPVAQVINRLKYIQAELEPKHDKIKIIYKAEGSTLRFQIVEGNKTMSLPIEVIARGGSEPQDFSFNVSFEPMLGLFSDIRAAEAEFRIAINKPQDGGKDSGLFRTIDVFWLDKDGKVVGGSGVAEGKEPEGASQCRVTRFTTSRKE